MAQLSEVASLVDVVQKRIQQGNIDVPMLPEVASKVVRISNDPKSDASLLAKLIQSDQPLAGHVMRIANSALYSPSSSMVSMQQAITRLGMRVVADIALAASVNSKMFNAPGYEQYIQSELQFSLAAGLWSKEVARACRRNVEAAFLAGLLHDIGRPVVIQVVSDMAKDLKIQVSKESMLELEQYFHRALGARVVVQWGMPSLVCDVVSWFDDYTMAKQNAEQTMIVAAGAQFARCFYKNTSSHKKITQTDLLASEVLADLNLYPQDVEDLAEKQDLISGAMEAMSQ